jgi:hypothetical protein
MSTRIDDIIKFCERCNGPCIASDPEPARIAELNRRARILAAWPLVEELLAEVIDIAHPDSDAYKTAVRLRAAVQP